MLIHASGCIKQLCAHQAFPSAPQVRGIFWALWHLGQGRSSSHDNAPCCCRQCGQMCAVLHQSSGCSGCRYSSKLKLLLPCVCVAAASDSLMFQTACCAARFFGGQLRALFWTGATGALPAGLFVAHLLWAGKVQQRRSLFFFADIFISCLKPCQAVSYA